MPNKDNINTGNSGEYFVAGELARRGFIVAVPMSNVENFDILAIHRTSHKQIAVQVKTTSKEQKKWTLTAESEKLKEKAMPYLDDNFRQILDSTYNAIGTK